MSQTFQEANRHHQAGRFEKANALYRLDLQQRPQHAEGWHLLGLTEAELGQMDAALHAMNKAIALAPSHQPYYLNRALIHQRANNLQAAFKDYHTVLAMHPTHEIACTQLGDLWLACESPKKAMPYYQQVLTQNPRASRVWHNLGIAYLSDKQFEPAIQAFAQAYR